MDVKIKCDSLDHFGRGMGRYNNKVIFVPNLLPLEEAMVRITLDKKKYMEGEVIRYLKKSSRRVCPKCIYNSCGCGLNNMSYEDSLDYKIKLMKQMVPDLEKKILSHKLYLRKMNKENLDDITELASNSEKFSGEIKIAFKKFYWGVFIQKQENLVGR